MKVDCVADLFTLFQLLYSNMLSAMAYCELAQRNPVENAVEILKKALDKFSLMITNREYNDLQIP